LENPHCRLRENVKCFSKAMSEFKYACPVCGQHIKCDSSQAGTVMECPTCFQKIIVPQAPATNDPKFIITGTKVGERPVPKFPEARSSFIPAAKGFPGALVVVIILIFIGAAVAFVYRGKIFKSNPLKPQDGDRSSNSSNAEPPHFQPEKAANNTGNLAFDKPAFASSQQARNPVQNGNDGNARTRWCASSGRVPQWWKVDLGAMATITNTQLIWEHNGVYQYKIETSPNNIDWKMVVNKTANSISARVESDNFSASARFVRIVVTGLQPGSWASFYEFEAFGSGG